MNNNINVKLTPPQGIRVDLDTVYVYDDTSIGNGVLTLQKNGETLDTFTANSKVDKTVNITVPTKASDIGALPDTTVIPTVNDATLTIQKNGSNVATFTANSSSNATANITVPTKTSDLTNDDGFITGISSSDITTALGYTPADSSSLATVATSGLYSDLTGTPTIPTVNNPTITITQGGVNKGSFTLNQSSGETIALDAGGGGGSSTWGSITGTLSDQIDLKNALDAKVSLSGTETITNKTIDADDNTIQDLEVDNFKSGIVRTTIRTNAQGASDDCIATEKAIYTALIKKGTYEVVTNPSLIPSSGVCTWEIDYSSYSAMAFPANIQVYNGDKQILVDIENDSINLKYKIKILSTDNISSGTLNAMIIHQ